MASVDKENVAVTPQKATVSNEYSPSNPKRALKPVSPNKYNNVTVGKLNFVQNDLDDHFDYIHGSNEEIKQQLTVIEAQTKQTNDDLEQLFDRLKNNNQHLNKLLESIAAYSEEVTTEGNATKSDVSKILARLSDLSPSNLEQLVSKLLADSKDNTIKEFRTLLSDSQGDPDDASIEVLLKLSNVERVLNKLADSSTKNLERYASSVSAETTNELSKVSALLRHSSDSQKDTIDAITRKIDALNAGGSDILLLQKQLEQQNTLIESLQRQIMAHNEFKDLLHKHAQLQQKYDTLCGYYLSKYSELVQLERRFGELTNTVDKLDSRVASIDVQKYDRLHQMHTELSQPETLRTFLLKRVASMPIHAESLPGSQSSEEF